eukprot:TRINITY_DN41922_c0_g1_i1.p1 TRINITY_DN41922_c0_g1~~TRINITY_DN41922_c0_g1_i1.p1  ORF type:complete len:561 (-),score=107.59 TRINITY_DN41922_c0_g1_i1:29-1711(-)
MQLLSALPVEAPQESRSKWASLRARCSMTLNLEEVVQGRRDGDQFGGQFLNDEEAEIKAYELEVKARAGAVSSYAGTEDNAPWLHPRPDEKLEEVVAFFFKHASAASLAGKPLRFHMNDGRDHAYGMIISKDLRTNPGRCYVILAEDSDRLRQIAQDLRRYDLKVGMAIQGTTVFLESDCDALVCCQDGVQHLKGRRFRIKVVEETSTPLMWARGPEVEAEVSVHFVKDDGADRKAQRGGTGSLLYQLAFGSTWEDLAPSSMLWKAIIRPPRAEYSEHDLGLASFMFANHAYDRDDFEIAGSRGNTLQCSHFCMRGGKAMKSLCVVYLHGNCSSRLEAYYVLPMLLTRGISVFTLDLSGSGMSAGEHISLGYYEEQDVELAIRHLKDVVGVHAVALWGRSMGAAAAIFRAQKDPDLAACVLDSAFSDLRRVVEEYVDGLRVWVPNFALQGVLEMCRQEVQERAGFDPFGLRPLDAAPKARCPAIFAVATDDRFILPHHTLDLHDCWGGPRVLSKFTGGHAGRRPEWFLEEAADFLMEKLVSSASRRLSQKRHASKKRYAL